MELKEPFNLFSLKDSHNLHWIHSMELKVELSLHSFDQLFDFRIHSMELKAQLQYFQ